MDSDLYTVGLAARRLGIGPERVRQLCDAGALEHVRTKTGQRLIPASALEHFAAERKRRQIKSRWA